MNYYGDNNRWFLARVVRSVTGSSKDGLFDRVQIRVIGLHSPDVPDKDLVDSGYTENIFYLIV